MRKAAFLEEELEVPCNDWSPLTDDSFPCGQQATGPGLEQCDEAGAEGRTITAASHVMRQLLAQVRDVAASKAPVLIEGESGTGKELLAHMVHTLSLRQQGPFVRVNCAALSETLVESEFYGHERGAFTGAEESRPGRFELADGGTLLLDEISEMPVRLQAKLLRVLEEGEFERVGGTRTLSVDVRLIATSNRNLLEETARGTFRRDLFYRLNTVHLKVPPLRERKDDVPVLAAWFLRQFHSEGRVRVSGISERALDLLAAYDWPGNVRQLRNVIHRACLAARARQIQPADLPALQDEAVSCGSLQGKTLAQIEREVILATLKEAQGNRTVTAKRLGITTRTLLNKLNKYRWRDTNYGVAG